MKKHVYILLVTVCALSSSAFGQKVFLNGCNVEATFHTIEGEELQKEVSEKHTYAIATYGTISDAADSAFVEFDAKFFGEDGMHPQSSTLVDFALMGYDSVQKMCNIGDFKVKQDKAASAQYWISRASKVDDEITNYVGRLDQNSYEDYNFETDFLQLAIKYKKENEDLLFVGICKYECQPLAKELAVKK